MAGTVVSVLGAVLLLGTGRLALGATVVTLSVLTDALDGTMARMSGGSTRWGAFLDSSLDRFADGAVLASLAFWFATGGDDDVLCAVALVSLVLGSITSYVKARAQSLDMTCDVGIVERTERLVLALFGALRGRARARGRAARVPVGAGRAERRHRRPAAGRGAPASGPAVVVSLLPERVAALLTDGAYAGGWGLVKALPEPVAVRLFDVGADLAWRRGGRGVDRLAREPRPGRTRRRT